LDEAEVEHASAKDLIAQIESMNSADEKYAAKVMVLGEYINHHIKEEQNEMFPKAKKAKVDLNALGEKISMRKQQLKAEMGIEDEQGAEAGMQPPRPRARFGRTAQAERS
jgi:hemerythrin-like domain-containing protein